MEDNIFMGDYMRLIFEITKRYMNYRTIWFNSILILLLPGLAFSGSVTLSWEKSDSALGYNIYYGEESRNYGIPISVGDVNTYKIDGLAESVIYYFALTSVDANNNESGFSNEVSKIIEGSKPINSMQDSPLIENLVVSSGKQNVGVTLSEGAIAFIDRDKYLYTNVPEFLIGGVYIQTAVRDISRANYSMTFDLQKKSEVYIVHSDGESNKPNWMDGFKDTGYNLQFYKTSSIYSKTFQAGKIEIGENGTSANDMYTVVLVALDNQDDALGSSQ